MEIRQTVKIPIVLFGKIHGDSTQRDGWCCAGNSVHTRPYCLSLIDGRGGGGGRGRKGGGGGRPVSLRKGEKKRPVSLN